MNVTIIKQGVSQYIVKRLFSQYLLRKRQIEKTQWFGEEELRRLQLKLLRRIVSHSVGTVPFYQQILKERGLSKDFLHTLEDIKQLPVTTKADVIKAGDDMICSRYSKKVLRKARTGGSTGTPLIIYRNWLSIGNEHAFVNRQWNWADIKFSDRRAYFMSRVVADADRQDGKLYAYDSVMNDLILSTHHLSAETADIFVKAIKEYKIKALVGYPSAISFLGKLCLQRNIKVPLKTVLTTSELLTESMKETIEEAFSCRVFDFYGGAERVCYIHTCEHGNYHVVPEYGFTELIPVSDSEPNKCKVISTGFWNRGMPLLRYDTGDIVIKSDKKCPCGRHFQVIESICGREGDIIKTPSGRHLGVTLLMQLLYVICGVGGIAESQVVQDAIDHITIKYVPVGKLDENQLTDFRKVLDKYLPSELKFDFQEVDSVEKTKAGKVRPLVSLIQ
jgi:phenylacetate-CoA ligase